MLFTGNSLVNITLFWNITISSSQPFVTLTTFAIEIVSHFITATVHRPLHLQFHWFVVINSMALTLRL